jgi:hypothetical protein
MALKASPIKKVIIVGAGASIPYGLPVASKLLDVSRQRVEHLRFRHRKLHERPFRPYQTIPQFIAMVSGRSALDKAALTAIGGPDELDKLADAFKHDLVQQNLDDFVRDHPSYTDAVSMLIAIALFEKMYQERDNWWWLHDTLAKGGKPPHEDWMRSLVGILRPKLSKENRLAVVSFNYDGLLERSMRMYWPGSETKYAPFADCIEFVYPHGRFSDLPEHTSNVVGYLGQQAKNLRLGDNKDEAARDRAQELVAEASRIYSVGFSFSPDNLKMLKLEDVDFEGKCVVQNYGFEDIRLNRLMGRCNVAPERRDPGDMDTLIRNGFFDL